MKTFIVQKKGKDIVFDGRDGNEVIRKLYIAGNDGSLDLTESVCLTDRLEVLEGREEPGVFSWTEGMTSEEIRRWKEENVANVILV